MKLEKLTSILKFIGADFLLEPGADDIFAKLGPCLTIWRRRGRGRGWDWQPWNWQYDGQRLCLATFLKAEVICHNRRVWTPFHNFPEPGFDSSFSLQMDWTDIDAPRVHVLVTVTGPEVILHHRVVQDFSPELVQMFYALFKLQKSEVHDVNAKARGDVWKMALDHLQDAHPKFFADMMNDIPKSSFNAAREKMKL